MRIVLVASIREPEELVGRLNSPALYNVSCLPTKRLVVADQVLNQYTS